MKYLWILTLGCAAIPAFAKVNNRQVDIEDLTIVAEKGVSPEALKKALTVASTITYPSAVTQGIAPNVYTSGNSPYSVTAGNLPTVLNSGNFPSSYTMGGLVEEGSEGAFPMPNTNL